MNALTHLTKLDIASIGVGLLVAFLFFKPLFGNSSGFRDSWGNFGSWLPGRNWVNVEWAELKIEIWLLLSVGSGFLAHYNLPGWFPKWFP